MNPGLGLAKRPHKQSRERTAKAHRHSSGHISEKQASSQGQQPGGAKKGLGDEDDEAGVQISPEEVLMYRRAGSRLVEMTVEQHAR